jgi:hypothetical protein
MKKQSNPIKYTTYLKELYLNENNAAIWLGRSQPFLRHRRVAQKKPIAKFVKHGCQILYKVDDLIEWQLSNSKKRR